MEKCCGELEQYGPSIIARPINRKLSAFFGQRISVIRPCSVIIIIIVINVMIPLFIIVFYAYTL